MEYRLRSRLKRLDIKHQLFSELSMVQMEKFKYLGKTPNPSLRYLTGKYVDPVEFSDAELKTFRDLFYNQVSELEGRGIGSFRNGDYKYLPSQAEAFNRLKEVLDQSNAIRFSATSASSEGDEFVARVQAWIPIRNEVDESLFIKTLEEDSGNFAQVSFYIGVCKEFASLAKSNEQYEKPVTAPKPDYPMADLGAPEVIRNFRNPDKVIPEIIDRLHLVCMQTTVMNDEEPANRCIYRSREGHILHIVIDGYLHYHP